MFTPTHSDLIDHRRRRWFGRRHLTVRRPRRHLIDLAGPLLALAVIAVLVLAAAPEADTGQTAPTPGATILAPGGQPPPDTNEGADTTLGLDVTGTAANGQPSADTSTTVEGDTSDDHVRSPALACGSGDRS